MDPYTKHDSSNKERGEGKLLCMHLVILASTEDFQSAMLEYITTRLDERSQRLLEALALDP